MLDRYKNLIKVEIKNKVPETFFPRPTELDYQRGFINRYFIQMRATPGAPIFEVNEDVYSQFENSEYYNRVSINWKIKGNLEDSYTEKGEFIPSVHTVNKLIIQEAEKTMSELNLYLVNTKQFHKLV